MAEIQRELRRAVVLAGGRGARMRAPAPGVSLEAGQVQAAEHGLKGLVPFEGQPFLAYVLTAIADAGYADVCLVTGPADDPIRKHFERVRAHRLNIHFAVQEAPLGSAHALLAAEQFSAGEDIAVINSDNLYPANALAALRDLNGSGLIGFRHDGLLAGNIDATRIAGYALIECDEHGTLTAITEKPDAAMLADAGSASLVSMTCWRFRCGIFDAIRETPRSVRGEYEIPDAVRLAMRQERFEVIPLSATVLDLSRREDIPRVARLLHGKHAEL